MEIGGGVGEHIKINRNTKVSQCGPRTKETHYALENVQATFILEIMDGIGNKATNSKTPALLARLFKGAGFHEWDRSFVVSFEAGVKADCRDDTQKNEVHRKGLGAKCVQGVQEEGCKDEGDNVVLFRVCSRELCVFSSWCVIKRELFVVCVLSYPHVGQVVAKHNEAHGDQNDFRRGVALCILARLLGQRRLLRRRCCDHLRRRRRRRRGCLLRGRRLSASRSCVV